jgi:hypothetical protein
MSIQQMKSNSVSLSIERACQLLGLQRIEYYRWIDKDDSDEYRSLVINEWREWDEIALCHLVRKNDNRLKLTPHSIIY